MRPVRITRSDGAKDLMPAYSVDDFPYHKLNTTFKLTKAGKNPAAYSMTFGMFDIETTTILDAERAFGYMYHWQIDLGGYLCYGRYWDDFFRFIDKAVEVLHVDDENRLVIYVFNLAFEYQFLYRFLQDRYGELRIFATAPRKPLRVNCSNGLEFRCAYKLTNMSLAKACENEAGVQHWKAKGDLDYRKIRTADTYINGVEFGYCMTDVVCGYELIQQRLKNEHDNLDTIPMTSTSYPRRDVRKSCRKDKTYRKKIFLKNVLSKEVYILLKEASRGGNTHANRFLSGRIWRSEGDTHIDSFDKVSSYPAQLLYNPFPMTAFTRYGNLDNWEELDMLRGDGKRALLFRVTFEHLRIKEHVPVPYIAEAKCRDIPRGIVLDNGRVLNTPEGSAISMTLTDIDWDIIRRQYEWDNCAIYDVYFADYGYLPEAITKVIKDYFRIKCELKYAIEHGEDTEDMHYLYGKIKNKLNGIFGMMYTDPIHLVIKQDPESGEWLQEVPDIEKALEKYNKSYNSFLVYSWGTYTTAWGRKELQDLLDVTGDGTIYTDTDSSKAINADLAAIERLNQQLMEKCIQRGAYCDVKGERFYLGLIEKENKEPIKAFKTLGAKKYAYVDRKGLHTTISGVNKKLGAKEMGTIDNFVPGFVFQEAGGLELYYNDEDIHDIVIDGCRMQTAANIGMVDGEYTLGITDEYSELIGFNMLKEFL